ncbi:zinc finger and SCAN domain-containing protein 2 isoform X2 [Anolis carolinensis]|uniref:zinc finger and SCAN domain-containing protein 2 isoform X2 n=1 Tax=Anolis carolinensis TaxID=28377 RepID=UPI002F2B6411
MDDPQETGVTVFLLPEIKMEEQDSVGLEAEDENASEEHRGSREEDPQRIKQEPVEEPSKNWDAQLEEFLRTLQPVCSEEETPQTSEVEQQRDPKTSEVPSQGETKPNKQASKLCVSPRTQPHLVEGTQLVFGAHLDADSYGKKREKALAGDAARLEMRRQHFRTLRYQEADGPRELCKQLQQQCRKWLNPDRNTKERMLELVTLEHFLAMVPAEMLGYLWDNGPVTCAKAVALAEDFLQSQQRDRDLEEQEMQELSDTEDRHETKQKDKASANLLEIGEWLKDRKEENPFLDRPEKMSAFLKTENDNHFLCQGESEKGQQKTDGQNGNATEEKRDLYVDSHGGCKGGDESTIQQDVDMKYDRCKQGTQESSLELEKPYKCWHCGQSFSSSSDLLSHERNHVGEQLYRCSHCGGSERIHMGQRPHKCSHCGNTFGCNPQEETNGGKKFHTCAECGEKYMHRSGLLKHQGVHWGEKPYKCLTCGENFGNYSNFRTHCRTHTGEKQYKCLQCEMCFSSIACLRAHERIHVVVCSSCGKSFRNKSELIEHERTHAREDSFVCFDCGKAFKFNSELMAHVRTHKDKKLECPDTKKTLICLECGDNFKHGSAFKTHQRVHRDGGWMEESEEEKKPILEHPEQMELPVMLLKTDQEPDESQYKPERQNGGDEEERECQLVCPQVVCKTENEPNIQEVQNVKYEERDENFGLSLHLTMPNSPHEEEKEKPYQCWHCGQSFSSSSDLLSHERSHVGEKLYTCSNCGESERIHMGQKPHRCSTCGNTFVYNTQQEKQRRKKIHVCPICGKAYMKISSFLQHQGLHRGEKPYKCSKCAENFGTFSSLRVHRRTHTSENQYKCSYCGMCFSCSPRLRAHERTHMAMCSYCGKSFNKKSELIEHERTHSRGDSLACFVCRKAFEVISELVFHVRTHTDMTPKCSDSREIFQCSQCGSTFSHGVRLTSKDQSERRSKIAALKHNLY